MGFILMYDVTNEESFSAVQDWCTQIKTYSWDNAQVSPVPAFVALTAEGFLGAWLMVRDLQIFGSFVKVILVGNKSDMEDERVVSAERGKQLADQLGLHFFETSAKDNVNVKGRWKR